MKEVGNSLQEKYLELKSMPRKNKAERYRYFMKYVDYMNEVISFICIDEQLRLSTKKYLSDFWWVNDTKTVLLSATCDNALIEENMAEFIDNYSDKILTCLMESVEKLKMEHIYALDLRGSKVVGYKEYYKKHYGWTGVSYVKAPQISYDW